jgi:hypothetical protein
MNVYERDTCALGHPFVDLRERQAYGRDTHWRIVPIIVAEATCGNDDCISYWLQRPGVLAIERSQQLEFRW